MPPIDDTDRAHRILSATLGAAAGISAAALALLAAYGPDIYTNAWNDHPALFLAGVAGSLTVATGLGYAAQNLETARNTNPRK